MIGASGSVRPESYDRFVRLSRRFAQESLDLERTSRDHLAEVDALTGLFNRHSMWRQLESERARGDRSGHPVCVAMVDLDGFKGINDRYGHRLADAVLKSVARRFERDLRPYDLVYRYGGDEFLVCMPEATPGTARGVLRRLTHHPVLPDGTSLTASIGVATMSAAIPVSQSIDQADRAAYASKRAGGGCVEVWPAGIDMPEEKAMHAIEGDIRARIIFVATDLSEAGNEALRQGDGRARDTEARLLVCHIVPSLMGVNMLFPHRHAEQRAAQAQLQERALIALVERTCEVTGREPSDFTAVVEEGIPYAGVVSSAEKAGAELIVVGSRGATGLSRVLLGSVAERIVRYAHAPVLVARRGPETRTILVATDLSDPSLPALTAAAHEAQGSGARLIVIHCLELTALVAVPEYGGLPSQGMPPIIPEGAREGAMGRLAGALEHLRLEGDRRIVEGFPPTAILSTAEEVGADLIVLGTRGRTGIRRVLLGSVAEDVLRRAKCSVLVVRLAEDAKTPPS